MAASAQNLRLFARAVGDHVEQLGHAHRRTVLVLVG
jgi:hypothetical protein